MSFGADGELIFRSLAKGNALARIKTDGTGFERIPTVSFLDKGEVSPDGEWVIIHAPATGGSPRSRRHWPFRFVVAFREQSAAATRTAAQQAGLRTGSSSTSGAT